MKNFLIIPLVALFLVSCNAVPKEPMCKEPMYVSGEVLLAKYTGKNKRTVLYKTDLGDIVIDDVPMDVNLVKIPVCVKYRRFVYFKK